MHRSKSRSSGARKLVGIHLKGTQRNPYLDRQKHESARGPRRRQCRRSLRHWKGRHAGESDAVWGGPTTSSVWRHSRVLQGSSRAQRQNLESRLHQPVPAALQAPCQALPSWLSAKSQASVTDYKGANGGVGWFSHFAQGPLSQQRASLEFRSRPVRNSLLRLLTLPNFPAETVLEYH